MLFMGNPGAIVTLVASYLFFVLKLGPHVMARRKPMELKYHMVAYNMLQVFLNTYLVCKLLTHEKGMNYIMNHTCQPLDHRNNPLRLEMCSAYWQYMGMKILDLMDTIFMVLRKKQENVSFLHVYHHSSMVFLSWLWFKYLRVEQFIVLGALNLFVHSFMYSYYLISSFGPQIKTFLWWKRYVTWIQIIQFCIGILYLFGLLAFGCKIDTASAFFWACNLAFFLVLFLNFYYHSYQKTKRKSK
ncbi:very long chain fatty acid elongase AAEL008004-like [Lycorma delicatula]|uniref:very long chain fatty acid elongase AAEL008004-like n=1 Tax=Lycorma delicatula TaxID=130591 RepID=UPI003F51A3A6